MKLQIELNNLSKLYYDSLQADLQFFKTSVAVEIYELLDKLRNDRNLMNKIVHAMQHLPGGHVSKITYEGMIASLETLEGLDLIDFKISPLKDNKATAIIEASDLYFNYVTVLKKSYIGKLCKQGLTPRQFKEHIIKIMNKDYPKSNIIVTELE